MKFPSISFAILLCLATSVLSADGFLDTGTFNSPSGFRTTNLTTTEDVGEAAVQQPDGKIVVAGRCAFRFCVFRYNTDGSLDNTFAGDGIADTTINGIPKALFLQPDGKIVTVSSETVVRLLAEGTLDTTFGGGDGHVTVNFGIGGLTKELTTAVLMNDGKIFAAGYRATGSPPPDNTDIVLVRFTADGALDTSFDSDGIMIVELTSPATAQAAADAVLTPDGKVLIAGWQGDGGAGYAHLLLVRYNADGSLDTSFDGDGWLTTGVFPNNNTFPATIAFTPSGRIVVGGSGGGGEGLPNVAFFARYSAAGVLDTSFDGDGIFTPAQAGNVSDLLVQPDGKMVAVQGTWIVKRNADGSYDTTFANAGRYTGLPGVRKVILQVDGKVVATGTTATPSSSNSSLITARLLNTVLPPSSAAASVSGRVLTMDGAGLRNAIVSISGGDLIGPLSRRTSAFGYYRFESLTVGQTYVVTVASKRFSFTPRVVTLTDDLADFDFFAGTATFGLDRIVEPRTRLATM